MTLHRFYNDSINGYIIFCIVFLEALIHLYTFPQSPSVYQTPKAVVEVWGSQRRKLCFVLFCFFPRKELNLELAHISTVQSPSSKPRQKCASLLTAAALGGAHTPWDRPTWPQSAPWQPDSINSRPPFALTLPSSSFERGAARKMRLHLQSEGMVLISLEIHKKERGGGGGRFMALNSLLWRL